MLETGFKQIFYLAIILSLISLVQLLVIACATVKGWRPAHRRRSIVWIGSCLITVLLAAGTFVLTPNIAEPNDVSSKQNPESETISLAAAFENFDRVLTHIWKMSLIIIPMGAIELVLGIVALYEQSS